MRSSKRDLIVPIRDRRKRKRYVTLRNFGILTASVLVVLVSVNLWSEYRAPRGGDHGRLSRMKAAAELEQRPIEVVQEAPAPVRDLNGADPMLVEPMARSQWLTRTDSAAVAAMPVETAPPVRDAMTGDVTIVGGPGGVEIVRTQRRRPVLSGGFGR